MGRRDRRAGWLTRTEGQDGQTGQTGRMVN